MTISPRTVSKMRENYLAQTLPLLEQALAMCKQEHEKHLARIERELKKLRDVEISEQLFLAFVSMMRRAGSRYDLPILGSDEWVNFWENGTEEVPAPGQRHAYLVILFDEMKTWQVEDEQCVPRFLELAIETVKLNRGGELIPYDYGDYPFAEKKEDVGDVQVTVF